MQELVTAALTEIYGENRLGTSPLDDCCKDEIVYDLLKKGAASDWEDKGIFGFLMRPLSSAHHPADGIHEGMHHGTGIPIVTFPRIAIIQREQT